MDAELQAAGLLALGVLGLAAVAVWRKRTKGEQTPPAVAVNPPLPAGFHVMKQADVTAEMTAWAVSINNDVSRYPMGSIVLKKFARVTLARVEWHPPSGKHLTVHRGVTLYQPIA